MIMQSAESRTIQAMRDRQLTRGIQVTTIIATFALLGSLGRIAQVGWHNVMLLHILLYVLFVSMALFQHRLSFHLRAGILLAISVMIGISGLIAWGIMMAGVPAFFSLSIIATLAYGKRAGVAAVTFSIILLGVIGMGFHLDFLSLNFDLEAYATSISTWITTMTSLAMSAGIIVVVIGTLNTQMETLVHTLKSRNNQLLKTNRKLELKIQAYNHSEKERQALASRLRQAHKMEVLGTLAGGVAHDLNNVLMGAVSYPDMLLTKLPKNDPMHKSLNIIKKSGSKAAAMVNDLLTLARGGVTFTEAVNLNTVVSDYLESPEFDRLIQFHPGVKVEQHLEDGLANIIGSPIQLSKIIMNLVSNAAEAMPDGGTLSITTEKRHLEQPINGYDLIENGTYVVLKVSDRGIGISDEEKERIFEPFFTKKTMGRSGTGLGMAVVWSTLRDHQGLIDVESTIGEGTTFWLYFPETPTAVTTRAENRTVGSHEGNGETILVVDDLTEQREITTFMLQKLGYNVNTAANGLEAISYFEHDTADLVVLNMQMEPGMDGLETYQRILELCPGQKALIVSGFSETKRVKEAQRIGAGGFIKKPYLMEELALVVKDEIHQQPVET
jgi:signal transduction histidine kinase/ActR/RegA family two-component response regulator